jgi:hypothetical protein
MMVVQFCGRSYFPRDEAGCRTLAEGSIEIGGSSGECSLESGVAPPWLAVIQGLGGDRLDSSDRPPCESCNHLLILTSGLLWNSDRISCLLSLAQILRLRPKMLGNNPLRIIPCVVIVFFLGCGSQPSINGNPGSQTTGLISGRVHGGQQPVSGATIQLYAVASSGGSPSTALISVSVSVTSASDGTFTITGDYTCPSGGLVYLTATGGNPGITSSNSNIALMTALGRVAPSPPTHSFK